MINLALMSPHAGCWFPGHNRIWTAASGAGRDCQELDGKTEGTLRISSFQPMRGRTSGFILIFSKTG